MTENTLIEQLRAVELTPETFGAVGDGSRDDTAAFQRAVNVCELLHKAAALEAKNAKIAALKSRVEGLKDSIKWAQDRGQ